MPISDEMVEAAAKVLARMNGDYGGHWLRYSDEARAALEAAEAVRERTHVLVPRDDALDVVASLAATISIIERTPQARKAAMSDKAFGIMLDDYTKALAKGRATLASSGGKRAGD